MEKKYDILLYPQTYNEKAKAKSMIGMIKNSILNYPVSYTIKEIAAACASGHPMALFYGEGSTALTKTCWRSQQVYALDFDNEDKNKQKFKAPYYLTFKKAVGIAVKREIPPAFVYTTGSHTAGHHKFRMIFVLDNEVTTVEEHDMVYEALSSMFVVNGKSVVDSSCKDRSRVFFGGKKIVYDSYGSVVDKEKLINTYLEETCQGNSTPPASARHPTIGTESRHIQEVVKAIKNDIKAQKNGTLHNRKSSQTLAVIGVEAITAVCHKIYTNNRYLVTQCKKSATLDMTRVPEDFYEFCHHIPIDELFGIEKNEKFICFLPDHEDTSPSASIIEYNGEYSYCCFGCDSRLDILQLIETLTGCTMNASRKFIAMLFNIKYETEWQRNMKKELHGYSLYFLSDEFSECYPLLQKCMTRSLMVYFDFMLSVMEMLLCDHGVSGVEYPIFYISESRLCELSGRKGLNVTRSALHYALKKLCRLGLLEALADDSIPPKIKLDIRRYQAEKKQHLRMTCYHIPIGSYDLFKRAEEIIEEDKKKSARVRTMRCREGVIRSDGKEAADSIFVQSSKKKMSKDVEKFYRSYKHAAERFLDKKGWTTEKEILHHMKLFTPAIRQTYSFMCLPQLLQELGLQRVPYTKKIQSELQINSEASLRFGSSRIIIKLS
jgi:hypothetical protein